jgi:hypothetical protein
MKICLMTKASMRGKNRWPRFSHTSFWAMGFTNYGVVQVFNYDQ